MSIYKKLSKMNGDGSVDEKLYRLINTDRYKSGQYRTDDLGEGMAVVYQVIWGWWKPRFVLNHNDKTAFELMDGNEYLVTVTQDDIDWESLKKLPEYVVDTARCLSFHFLSFVRGYRNGVARVDWQLNPDGRYYMDDDGFGMTSDIEIEIYGFIDRRGNVLVKFQAVENYADIDKLRKEAEMILQNQSNNNQNQEK